MIPKEIYEIKEINPHYTFDTFAMGPSNEEVFQHCKRFATTTVPERAMLLYGELGCGKTHLLHAIAQDMMARSNEQMLFITGERFVSDVRSVLAVSTTPDIIRNTLLEKYGQADIIICDDVHMITDVPEDGFVLSTKDCFEFIAEHFAKTHKRFVLAGDGDLKNIISRQVLSTVEKSGKIFQVNPPDQYTARKILQNELIFADLCIEDTVIDYIALNRNENVRVLLGTLNKLIAVACLENVKKIDMEFSKRVLAL